MTPTTERRIATAREWATLIRRELDRLEDVLSRAGEVGGAAFLYSLERAYESAADAVLHAVQMATPKVNP
jgi:hypothetical protein